MTDELIRTAKELGACRLIDKGTDLQSLAELMFSPKGAEFCEFKEFPSLEQFRRIDREEAERLDTYIWQNAPVITPSSGNCALVYTQNARIICEGADKLFTVLLFHGSSAVIEARDFAVVRIICIGRGNCHTVEGDGTEIIL